MLELRHLKPAAVLAAVLAGLRALAQPAAPRAARLRIRVVLVAPGQIMDRQEETPQHRPEVPVAMVPVAVAAAVVEQPATPAVLGLLAGAPAAAGLVLALVPAAKAATLAD